MQAHKLPPVAVIADAHLHDIHSDYDGARMSVNGRQLTLRTWKDTRRSSRVFNESRPALIEALERIRDSNIKIVVLLGDYTDDGQIESTQNFIDVVSHYQQTQGLSFFAIPGNHDYYGPCGKHQSTRFACSADSSVLVTSAANTAATEPDTAILTRKMYCEGAEIALSLMKEFGFYRRASDVHWETPFGSSNNLNERRYKAVSQDGLNTHWLIDSSYLVEPTQGLWLLMLDTNVFEPRNGQWNVEQKNAFHNSSDAGWNSVLSNKPHLINWIHDVTGRAKKLGKRLLTFSHYPTLDPFNDTYSVHQKLFGQTSVTRRKPHTSVADSLLNAGLQIHFGGHMHVNGHNQHKQSQGMLTDIAVPSLAAFPACYKLIEFEPKGFRLRTETVHSTKLDYDVMDYYKQECTIRQTQLDSALLSASYGDFLYQRLTSRVKHNYLPKHWPEEIASELNNNTTLDLFFLLLMNARDENVVSFQNSRSLKDETAEAAMISLAAEHHLTLNDFSNCALLELVADWYGLRDGREQAVAFIAPNNLNVYRFLSSQYGDQTLPDAHNHANFFRLLLGLLQIPLACLEEMSDNGNFIEYL